MPQMTLGIPLPHLQIRTGNGGEMQDRRHGKKASWATWASPGVPDLSDKQLLGNVELQFLLGPSFGPGSQFQSNKRWLPIILLHKANLLLQAEMTFYV